MKKTVPLPFTEGGRTQNIHEKTTLRLWFLQERKKEKMVDWGQKQRVIKIDEIQEIVICSAH